MTYRNRIVLAALAVAILSPCDVSFAHVTDIAVDTDTTVTRSIMGVGIQWDPSDTFDYTPDQWKMIYRRVDFMRPSFIRCCLGAGSYCTGFNSLPGGDGRGGVDSAGTPIYNWQSHGMQQLYPILDYCQSHHVDVLLGEWGPPFGMTIDDPRWSRLITDLLSYLVKKRGYTCIRYYNKQNEPSTNQSGWQTSETSLKADFTAKGLDSRVAVVGPDTSGTGLFSWVDFAASQMPGVIDDYERMPLIHV